MLIKKPKKRNEVELLKEAYQKGDNRAIYNLGWCYLLGASVEKDVEKAVAYFRKGARLKDSKCMQALAVCYRDGDGVPVDLNQMMHWLQQGVLLEDDDCIYQLALCYEAGLGVQQSQEETIKLMQQIQKRHKEARKYLKQKGIKTSKFKRK